MHMKTHTGGYIPCAAVMCESSGVLCSQSRSAPQHAPICARGQVATDALVAMERAMARDGIAVNDRQLACARIDSEEGQNYLKAMACAANYAWVNRSSMTFLARQAFAKLFNKTPDELDMHVIYDVSHNIAKVQPSSTHSHLV